MKKYYQRLLTVGLSILIGLMFSNVIAGGKSGFRPNSPYLYLYPPIQESRSMVCKVQYEYCVTRCNELYREPYSPYLPRCKGKCYEWYRSDSRYQRDCYKQP